MAVQARHQFQGKVALVSGGASGMGEATSLAFADSGAAVVIADLDTAGEVLAAKIRDGGGRASFVETDVSDEGNVMAWVDTAMSNYGRVDMAVNCAAVHLERVRIHELDVEVFDRVMAINTRGIFLSMKYQIRAMLEGGEGGAIVNIASVGAIRSRPKQTAYTASKHAVLGLTRAVGVDYAQRGIRVNAICPGGFNTPMLARASKMYNRDPSKAGQGMPIRRLGEPDEIAATALFLCSDEASYIAAGPIFVDGGIASL